MRVYFAFVYTKLCWKLIKKPSKCEYKLISQSNKVWLTFLFEIDINHKSNWFYFILFIWVSVRVCIYRLYLAFQQQKNVSNCLRSTSASMLYAEWTLRWRPNFSIFRIQTEICHNSFFGWRHVFRLNFTCFAG